MTNIFLLNGNQSGGIPASFTQYYSIGSGGGKFNATEAQVQITWRVAGTFSNLYCRVSTNSVTSASTVTYNVGGANGNESVSITGSASGDFTDSTHTDTVSSGNQIDYELVTGSGGSSINVPGYGIQFAPSTTGNTLNKLECNGSFQGSSTSSSYFNPLSGVLAKVTTEADAQFENKLTATLQNLYVYVSANTSAVGTLKSRIGGANGNLSVSITSGTTGVYEDTTHSDSLSSGNLFDTDLSLTSTSATITIIAVDFLTTNKKTHYIAASSGGASALTTNGRVHHQLAAGIVNGGTEAFANTTAGLSYAASNLESFIITNTITANSTIIFRVNSANGNQILTYGSGVTGYLEDTTHTDSVGSTAYVNYQVSAGATGTSIVVGNIGIIADYSPPANVATFSASGSFAATGNALKKSPATFTSSASFAAVGVTGRRGVSTFSASGVFAAHGSSKNAGKAIFSAAGTLSATGKTLTKGHATFSAAGSLAAHGKSLANSKATFTSSSTFSVHGKSLAKGVASFNAHASLPCVGVTARKGIATFTGAASLAAVSGGPISAKATFSAAGTLAAVGKSIAKSTATLSSAGTFSVHGTGLKRAAATFSASAALTFTGAPLAKSIATFSAHGVFAADGHDVDQAKLTISASASLVIVSRSVANSIATISATTIFSAHGMSIKKAVAAFLAHASLIPSGRAFAQTSADFNASTVFAAVGLGRVPTPSNRIFYPKPRSRLSLPQMRNNVL